MGFRKCLSDQCLLMRENKHGTIIICIHIDDTMIVGNREALDVFKKEISEFFATKEEGKMEEYVGCKVQKKDGCMFFHQSTLIEKMRKAFANKIAKLRKYTTPGTPGQGIVRPKEGEPKIGAEEQTEYRSGVGMLLFLVKYSRPDIANAVRELSKVNDGATKAHQKELLRLIKFVVDTKDWMLKYELKDESKKANKWVLKAFL